MSRKKNVCHTVRVTAESKPPNTRKKPKFGSQNIYKTAIITYRWVKNYKKEF